MRDDDLHRLQTPPHSIEAEQAVIGGLMLDNAAFDRVSYLSPDDFYRTDHGYIFRAIVRLLTQDKPGDVVTVAEVLDREKRLEDCGGLAYLANLARDTPSVVNVRSYANIIRDRAARRRLIHVANKIADMAYNPNDRSGPVLVEEAKNLLFDVNVGAPSPILSIRDAMQMATDKLQETQDRGTAVEIPTGIIELDRLLGGLHTEDFVIVGALPSVGKTAFGLSVGVGAAKHGIPVGFFSAEQPLSQLGMRAMAMESRIPIHEMRTGVLTSDQWTRLADGVSQLNDLPLYFVDKHHPNLRDVESSARNLVRQYGIKVLIIDYAQIIRHPNRSRMDRTTEIEEIFIALKQLQKQCNVALVSLSQVKREVASRQNKRPTMSDIFGSSAAEKEGDQVWLLYRDTMYNENADTEGAEIIIDKNRNGPIGTVEARYIPELTLFTDRGDRWSGPR